MVQLTYHRTATAIAISYGGSLFIGVSDVSYYSLAVFFIGVKDAMQFWDVLLPFMPAVLFIGSFVHWHSYCSLAVLVLLLCCSVKSCFSWYMSKNLSMEDEVILSRMPCLLTLSAIVCNRVSLSYVIVHTFRCPLPFA